MLVTINGNENHLSKNFTVQHTVAKQLNIKKYVALRKMYIGRTII